VTGYLWTPPAGVSLSSTAVAQPTFTAPVASGTYSFSLVVTDDETPSNNSPPATVNVTVNNITPMLAPIGSKVAVVNAATTFAVAASDVNGTAPTLSASGLPAGATFDPATGVFSWMPTAIGTVQATFTATDSVNPALVDSETITIQAVGTSLESDGFGGKCFIATAAYGTSMAEDVRYLRALRDQHLLNNQFGRWFVERYYALSPPVAHYIREHEGLRAVVRTGLKPLVELSKLMVSEDALAAQR
jgi:hypothetical protein